MLKGMLNSDSHFSSSHFPVFVFVQQISVEKPDLFQLLHTILLTHSYLEILSSVVWTYASFENNLTIKFTFTRYLQESYESRSDVHFSFKYFSKNSLVSKILPKLSGHFCWGRHEWGMHCIQHCPTSINGLIAVQAQVLIRQRRSVQQRLNRCIPEMSDYFDDILFKKSAFWELFQGEKIRRLQPTFLFQIVYECMINF